jgi:hypothetical protein
MTKITVHKLDEAEEITKRVIVCGEKYAMRITCSLDWGMVNCIDCLMIGVCRKALEDKNG